MAVLIFLGITKLFVICLEANNVLILTGVYSGENLYVQNPLLPDNRFSTEEVFVNEISVLSFPLTSAYTIDLSHLKVGQPVEIKIIHKENYRPKIINAHVIRSAKQNIISETIGPTGNVFRWTNADKINVRWLTHGEKGGGTFELQRANLEEWMVVELIPAKSVNDSTVYKVLVNHEQGENTYRIKLTNRDGYVSYSNLFSFFNK